MLAGELVTGTAGVRTPAVFRKLGVFTLLLRGIGKTHLAHRRVVRLGNALGHLGASSLFWTCGGGRHVAFEFSLDLVESWGSIENT